LVFAGAQGDDRIADFSGAVHVFDTATGENTTTVRNGRAHDDSAALFGRMVVGLGSRVAVAGFGGVSGVYEASARMELLQVPGRFNSRQSNAPDSSTIGANGRLYAPFGEVFEDLCGDGLVGIGEECDDGNVASGDGCSGSCRVESHAGWSCYKVRSGTAFVQPANVEIGTRIESERVTRVIKPAELCVPAGIGGGVPDPQAPALMCYKVKHARGEIKTPKTVFRFRDRFGEPVATVFKEKTLCVEATLS
jgi:cysteine-rich repeat protein